MEGVLRQMCDPQVTVSRLTWGFFLPLLWCGAAAPTPLPICISADARESRPAYGLELVLPRRAPESEV